MNITEEEVFEIRLLHSQMVLEYTNSDHVAYFKVNQEMHGGIFSTARNQILANMSQARWAKALEEHVRLSPRSPLATGLVST